MLHDRTTRRRLMLASCAMSLSVASRSSFGEAKLAVTPAQTPGPWYPQSLPLDVDNDLVRISGQNRDAAGDVTHIFGRILDTNGVPIRQARVEIWQVDSSGRYHHVADGRSSLGELDPYFQGYGTTATASDGGYRFRTIRPVAYSRRSPLTFTLESRCPAGRNSSPKCMWLATHSMS